MNKNLKIMQDELLKIKKDFVKQIVEYKKHIDKSLYDVPIEVLCLPENIRKILLKNNILRVFDLRNTDLRKIKGLGNKRIGIIEFRLSQFGPM